MFQSFDPRNQLKNRIQLCLLSLCEILLLSRFLVNPAVDTCCTFTCPIFLEPAEDTNKKPEPDTEKPNTDKDEAITYRAQKRATGSLLLEAGWWPGGSMIILLGRMCFFLRPDKPIWAQHGPMCFHMGLIWIHMCP